jgi:hypothetical protein
MHYLLSSELLNKKSSTEEAGSHSRKVEFPSKYPMPSDSEEEEEHQLKCPKRTFPGCPKLLDEVVLLGKTINDILVVSFKGEVPAKNPRTDISPTVSPANS